MQRIRSSSVRLRLPILVVGLLALSGCASVSFKRNTETSGTFRSSGLALTILSIDMPKAALDIARENASDANLGNMVVETVMVTPYLGPLDWILDLISIRYARIDGTWGFSSD